MKGHAVLAALFPLLALAACGDDTSKPSKPAAATESRLPPVALVPLAPGGGPPVRGKSAEAAKFDGNPEAIAAGRQLFVAFNCVGCHFNGGGGIGPALMDNKWIYGSSMENIASTIREGRPNGMPSFRAMTTEDQLWRLAAYVRSLSGLGSQPAPQAASK